MCSSDLSQVGSAVKKTGVLGDREPIGHAGDVVGDGSRACLPVGLGRPFMLSGLGWSCVRWVQFIDQVVLSPPLPILFAQSIPSIRFSFVLWSLGGRFRSRLGWTCIHEKKPRS